MKLILLLVLSFAQVAEASFPELFGSSAGSMAIGNQPELNNAANNYYASALLGFSKTTQYSFSLSRVQTAFKDIHNVVTQNQTNTVNSFEFGNPSVNNTPTSMLTAHLSTPLFSPEGPKFNFSLFAPLSRLMETNSGDPYQPRYVMYDSRFIRPILIVGLAQSFGDWSFGLAAQNGFQSTGQTYFMTRTTAGNPSMAKLAFNYKPSIGLVGSVAKKDEKGFTYFNFQQEIKSELTNKTTGETEIASNASFPFDLQISTMLYYDPMTFRLGRQHLAGNSTFYGSLEYQVWENYQSTVMRMKKNGGVINGSSNYEDLKMQNIFVPKAGYQYRLNDQWSYKLGYFYRPSPIQTTGLKNAGNTIDVDKHVFSVGTAYDFMVMTKKVTIDVAYQGHKLKDQKITKTAGREDGDITQPKIGSPGYRIGGMIHVLSVGLSWML